MWDFSLRVYGARIRDASLESRGLEQKVEGLELGILGLQ